MEYSILSKDHVSGTVCIRPLYSGEDLSIKIPERNGTVISDEELDDYLSSVVDMRYEELFFETITDVLFTLKFIRFENIGYFYNTVPQNGTEKELKINRLFMVGSIILKDPLKYAGIYFNGSKLPTDKDAIIKCVNDFMDNIVIQSNLIEEVLIHYNKRIDELMICKTIEEVKKVKW